MGAGDNTKTGTILQINQCLDTISLRLRPRNTTLKELAVSPTQEVGVPLLGPIDRDVAQPDRIIRASAVPGRKEVVDLVVGNNSGMKCRQGREPVKAGKMVRMSTIASLTHHTEIAEGRSAKATDFRISEH